MIQVFLGCEKSRRHPWVTTEWYIHKYHSMNKWCNQAFAKYFFSCSIYLNARGLKHRTALSAVEDQHFIPLLPKYCALCWILFPLPPSSWRRGLSRLQCVVQSTQLQSKISSCCFISLSFFFFFFQKSLRTLSQLHQKVSSDSYFLFKRRETICVAINFLSRLFYIVKTNQNSLLKNHCFLPAWTKYSLKCHSFQAHNCPADSSDKDN